MNIIIVDLATQDHQLEMMKQLTSFISVLKSNALEIARSLQLIVMNSSDQVNLSLVQVATKIS